MTHKRKSKRVLERLEVKYMSDIIAKTSVTGNLSEDGMFIKTKKKVPVGSMVDIKLELPNVQVIHLEGEVVRNMHLISSFLGIGEEKNGIGIRLIDPPQEYLDFIRSHIP